MPSDRFLAPAIPDDARARLTTLEAQLLQREHDLVTLKVELQDLQAHYLQKVGGLYSQLSELLAAVDEAEIRAGIRPPPLFIDGDEEAAGASDDQASDAGYGCSNPLASADGLKRVFRDVAKAIHPDLALDGPARFRRHSLMAEANRAYAERDEDRLRLILRTWEGSPDAILGDDPDADRRRVFRKIAEIDDRLIAIEGEFADLRRSAIWRLKGKIQDAKAQGWDLFSEMIMQVKREIATAMAKLAKIRG
jgi:hypothetical protein